MYAINSGEWWSYMLIWAISIVGILNVLHFVRVLFANNSNAAVQRQVIEAYNSLLAIQTMCGMGSHDTCAHTSQLAREIASTASTAQNALASILPDDPPESRRKPTV